MNEVATIVGGGTPSTKVKEYWGGDINWYSPVDLVELRYLYNSPKTITELGMRKSSAKMLPVNTILFTSRAGIGKTAIIKTEATTNQGFQSIVPDESRLHFYFIYSQTNSLKKYANKVASGSTFMEISSKQLGKYLFYLPDIYEQEIISNFFKLFDDMIALHQRKTSIFKRVKTELLNRLKVDSPQKHPLLRYYNFDNPWINVKVGEVFIVTRGKVLSSNELSKVKSSDTPYPVYSSQTKHNGLMGYYSDYLFENAITWTTDGANAGTVNYRKGKFYSTNVNGVLINKVYYPNYFFAEILNLIAWKHVSKVGNPKLMNNTMANIKLTITNNLEEICRLSELIKTTSKFILLHETRQRQFISLKKSFLQKLLL